MAEENKDQYKPAWLKGKRILIVEDEISNFELLRAMLRKSEVEIIWAKNGFEAIEHCKVSEFNLILMDIKMPEMNGYEAVCRIREMGVSSPIIAQTAYARIEDEAKILDMGFDSYISKPISRYRLFQMFEEILAAG